MVPERFFTFPSGSPVKEPPPPGFSRTAPIQRCCFTVAIFKPSFKVHGVRGPLQFPQHGRMEKGACFRSLLYVSSAVPNEQGRLKRQNVTFFSNVLTKGPSFMVHQWPPLEKSLLAEVAFTYLSESPVKQPSLQVPVAVVPLRVMLSYQSPLRPSRSPL